MRRLKYALMGSVFILAACASTSDPIYTAEATLTAAEKTADIYAKLPRCPVSTPVCSTQSIVTAIANADTIANAALAAAKISTTGDTTALTAAIAALTTLLANPAVVAAIQALT